MSSTRRRSGPGDVPQYLMAAAVGGYFAASLLVWTAARAAHALADAPRPSGNVLSHLVLVVAGRAGFGAVAWAILAAEVLALAAAVVAGLRWWRRSGRRRPRIDKAAAHLATRDELAELTTEGVTATARRLGVRADLPGVRVGRIITAGPGGPGTLWQSWEDTSCDIWGTRRGKTTARAVPAVLDAPGAVLVTSNKRDIVDCTRLPREQRGPVHIFDPQRLVGAEPTWVWDPLSYVVDVDHAFRQAAIFAAYSREPGARTDAYFDPEGEALLAFLLLAAATAGEPITTVYTWTTDPKLISPAIILENAGHHLPAQSVQGVIDLPDKQRAGIYGTAKKIMQFVTDPNITRWITDPSGERPRFNPHEFVAGTGTLYSLSQEGRAIAGPVVAALSVACVEAAEERAARSAGGRLAVPFLVMLDEAGNVCRWKDLPDLYSHLGSRGVILMTTFQTWAQGAAVWGEHGMDKLWSAANVRVYGGGVSDPKFLGRLDQVVGSFDLTTYSTSHQHGHGRRTYSTTSSSRPERVLDIADLAALPRGRALVFASGARPVLVETLPWQNGPHAEAVWQSLRTYAPANDLDTYAITTGDTPGIVTRRTG